jgi:Ca-activated chloride channel family protein
MFFKVKPHMSVISGNGNKKLHIKVSMKPENTSSNVDRLPINLACAIDRSESMSHKPIENAKEAMKFLVKNLTDKDNLAIVTFNSESEIIRPISNVRNKEKIYQDIDKIYASGYTNISCALSSCFEQLNSLNVEKDTSINRVLLLSDGFINVGLSGDSLLSNIRSHINNKDIVVSTFGLGNNYDKVILSEISNIGNGNFYHIETIDKIGKYYEEEFGDFISVALQDAQILVKQNPSYTVKHLYGYKIENDKYNIGYLYNNETRDVLLEVDVDMNKVSDIIEIPVCFSAKTITGNTIDLEEVVSVKIGSIKESEDSKDINVCKFADEILQAFIIIETTILKEKGMHNEANDIITNYKPHNCWNYYLNSGVVDSVTYQTYSDLDYGKDAFNNSSYAISYATSALKGRSMKKSLRFNELS